MLQKVIKTGLVGGAVIFVWGLIAWLVIPINKLHFNKFKNEAAVAKVMKENADENGFYQIPSMAHNDHHATAKEMKNDFFAFSAVKLGGKELGKTGSKVAMFIVDVIVASLAAWCLFQTKLDRKKSIVFITTIGFMLAFMYQMPLVIWLGFPFIFAFKTIIQLVIGWYLASLLMVRVAKK